VLDYNYLIQINILIATFTIKIIQAIKDEIRLLSPKKLNLNNAISVTLGHQVVGHQPGDPLSGKSDPFVLETNIFWAGPIDYS